MPLLAFRRSLPVVIAYLDATGFRFDYRADRVSVYWRTGSRGRLGDPLAAPPR